MFIRSLLHSPGSPALACIGGHRCPDILELDAGDFAVIGIDITESAIDKLPAGSGCGPGERIVRIPRTVLTQAKSNIPDPS
ncbi:MAG: hypothetical protein AB7O66_15190 [Limisphaerales bacterium]